MNEEGEVLTRKQQRKRETTNALAKLVSERFKAASSARQASGVTEMMTICKRASLSQPLTGVHSDPNFPVVFCVTSSITRGLIAVLNDTLTASAADLFTLSPTTDPALTPEAEDSIVGALEQQQMAMLSLGMQPSETETQAAARQLLAAAKTAGNEQAAMAADNLKMMIKDQLQENGFDAAIREGIHDFVSSVAMVIKAPSPRLKKTKVWENGRLAFRDEVVRGVERIDPVNLYPAPNAVDPQTADYLVELRQVSPNELAMLAAQEGYDTVEISRVFDMHPEGFKVVDDDANTSLLREPDQNTDILTTNTKPYGYQVLCMYGRVRGALLKEFGIEGVEDHLHYDAEVLTISDCVIRAVLNADPAGKRPFYVTSYDPVYGSFWGRSPTSHLIPLQRAATSIFVSMLADLSMAGIHVEVDPSRLHDDDHLERDVVRPRIARVVKANPAGNAKRAYDIFEVTPNTGIFQNQLDKIVERTYEVTGLQRFAIGQTTGVGTVGRTAGGLASLLNQASKGIKQVMRNLENDIIAPVVQHYVDYELMWGDIAAEFRGDVSVQAKGLTAVAEQAGQSDDLQWALQSLSSVIDKVDPATGQTFIPAAAMPRLLYSLFKAKGIPTAGIFPANFESTAVLSGEQAAGMPTPETPGLDGRSQTSINSIQQSNDIMGVGAGA